MTVHAVLLDLLMAVMNSLDVWAAAAGDRERGLAWRDAVTRRMAVTGRYIPYERLVAESAAEVDVRPEGPAALVDRWGGMKPWPDATALRNLTVPHAFVTNASAELAGAAAGRSGAAPRFVLSAEEAGWYKPHPAIYAEACRRIGATPATTLFVAGSSYDAAGADRAGLRTILVPRRGDQALPGGEITIAASLHEVVEALP